MGRLAPPPWGCAAELMETDELNTRNAVTVQQTAFAALDRKVDMAPSQGKRFRLIPIPRAG